MQGLRPNLFVLSAFWFAVELHWAAVLGAANQVQVARFVAPTFFGEATAILGGFGATLAIISQIVSGRASDRLRRRMPFVIAGTLLDIPALFAFALAPSFVAVIASFSAVEIAFNVAGGPYQALIPDRVDKSEQGRASGIMGLLRLVATAAGLVLARIFVHQPGPGTGPREVTQGLVMLAIVLSAVLLVALGITLVGVRDQAVQRAPQTQRLFAPWPNRASFIWLIISRAFVNAALYLVLPFLAFYLRFALHVEHYLKTSLDLLILMVLCSLVGTIPAGIWGDRVSKKTILFAALACLSAAALGLAFVGALRPVWAIGVVLGIAWGAFFSVDWALACNLLPEGRAAGLMAVWNIGAAGPQVASLFLGGPLVDHIGAATGNLGLGYRSLYILITILAACGALALIGVRESKAGLAQRSL